VLGQLKTVPYREAEENRRGYKKFLVFLDDEIRRPIEEGLEADIQRPINTSLR
jgi:hypothetical protein